MRYRDEHTVKPKQRSEIARRIVHPEMKEFVRHPEWQVLGTN
jgi:hypothetical protein